MDAHKLLGRVSIAGARLIAATTASHTMPTYTQQVRNYSIQFKLFIALKMVLHINTPKHERNVG
jgi:hypothetical protein